MLQEFITTVYRLVIAGQWDKLAEYFRLISEISLAPTMRIDVGVPSDKVSEAVDAMKHDGKHDNSRKVK